MTGKRAVATTTTCPNPQEQSASDAPAMSCIFCLSYAKDHDETNHDKDMMTGETSRTQVMIGTLKYCKAEVINVKGSVRASISKIFQRSRSYGLGIVV